jgi:hypothetical protein
MQELGGNRIVYRTIMVHSSILPIFIELYATKSEINHYYYLGGTGELQAC